MCRKKILFLFTMALFSYSVFGQNGWRTGEKEIRIQISNNSDAKTLYDLHLIGDFYPTSGYAIMYLIDSELELIKLHGLKYEITKADLNKYYSAFWNKRADGYHSYDQIIALMDSLASAFPEICKKTITQTSIGGRQIAFLKISDNVALNENEAKIAFDAGIHGDEVIGPENLIRFARYLCTSYGKNSDLTNLIDNREIYIYPMVNPDGRANMSRYNNNGIDCNRDYGYMWNGEGNSSAAFSQKETKTIRDFLYTNNFTTHITYHSGAEEVIFPWCYRSAHAANYASFYNQSSIYANSSGYSSFPYLQSYADYPTNGEAIDYSYGANGSIALTIELSNDKQPATTEIQSNFMKNINPMIAMIRYSGYGIEGIITDSVTGNPIRAAIFVNQEFPIYSDSTIGDYHKFVLPGTYSMKIVANNYESRILSGIICPSIGSIVKNIKLKSKVGSYVNKVAGVAIPGNNAADEAKTHAVIGAPDSVYYSIGKNGWIIVDMQQPIKNIYGNDFTVFEGDTSSEGFTCYASASMDGPWTMLGTGKGTTSFDLSSLNQAQYLKIMDDNDGVANIKGAGFDLDAIAVIQELLPTSIKPNNKYQPNIFPNPTNGILNVVLPSDIKAGATLELYTIDSKKLLSQKATQQSNVLDMSSYPAGVYMLKVISEEGTMIERVIKH